MSSLRFKVLPHNSIAIRDVLLGTNLHLESGREVAEVCDILNSMNTVAEQVATLNFTIEKQTVIIIKQAERANEQAAEIAKLEAVILHLREEKAHG